MIGDNIIIKPEYYATARELLHHLGKENLLAPDTRYTLGIGGESGSGKSVTATCLQEVMQQEGISSVILHQDDYFHLPPRSNHEARVRDINHVGKQEVDWEKLQASVNAFREGNEVHSKPIVYYQQNNILAEIVYFKTIQVLIVEGTYVLDLEGLQAKIFMDRDYIQTREQRIARGRENYSEFMEQILHIEHQLIRPMREQADIVILEDYSLAVKPH